MRTWRHPLGANQLPPRTAKEQQIGQQVANALAEKLVVEIRDLGLPAERGMGLPAGTATGLVISGQFVSVDQGNRTERVVLGLGAGRSDVRVRAQAFDVTPQGRRLADEIEVDAKSGLQPGMAETMGAGALTGHFLTATLVSGSLQVADYSRGASVVADFGPRRQGHRQAVCLLLRRAGVDAVNRSARPLRRRHRRLRHGVLDQMRYRTAQGYG